MAYEPTQWKAGDTVTSAKLNKIEQGIANAGRANILVAHCGISSQEESAASIEPEILPTSLDVTLGEILNADFTIVQIIIEDEVDYVFIRNIYSNDGVYTLHLSDGSEFYAEAEEDYPTIINQLPDGTIPTPT